MNQDPETAREMVFVYTTAPDVAAADTIAAAVVEAQLAACVNIYPGMRAVYRWEGTLQREEEVGLFIKTRRALAEPVMAAVRAVHPYRVPALLVLPVEVVSDDYLAWVLAQTEGGVSRR